MKTGVKTLAVLLLLGLFGSSCATVSRLDAEFEEETTRIEQMSPEEKAELENARRVEEHIDWLGYESGGED
jgi:hypothetical protein